MISNKELAMKACGVDDYIVYDRERKYTSRSFHDPAYLG